MSTTNIIEISGKSDDALYPENELGNVNKLVNSDTVVGKLSKIICRQLQKERDRQKQKKAANAYTTIFVCALCVVMAVVIITKLLEDEDRTNLYDTLSANSLPVKVYENQKRPVPAKSQLLVRSGNPSMQTRIATSTTESVASFNNSVTEASMSNEVITKESETNLNATTEDANDIPTVEPLVTVELQVSSSGNLNANNVCALSYLLIVLLIIKF